MTPYKITKLFQYHKEYHPQQFGEQSQEYLSGPTDAIDLALGGF